LEVPLTHLTYSYVFVDAVFALADWKADPYAQLDCSSRDFRPDQSFHVTFKTSRSIRQSNAEFQVPVVDGLDFRSDMQPLVIDRGVTKTRHTQQHE